MSHNNDDASFPAFKGKRHSFFSEHLNYRLFEIFTFSFQTSQIKDTAGYLLLLNAASEPDSDLPQIVAALRFPANEEIV